MLTISLIINLMMTITLIITITLTIRITITVSSEYIFVSQDSYEIIKEEQK